MRAHRSLLAALPPVAVPLALATLVGGCTPFAQYRCDHPFNTPELGAGAACLPAFVPETACDERSDPGGGCFSVGYVEFDDVGAFWSRQQLNHVLNQMSDTLDRGPTIVVVYIHGWKHDAMDEAPDQREFRELLEYVAKYERAQVGSAGRPRQVMGVYVGWRGASMRRGTWILDNLTFWDRKAAAHKVGGGNGVTELLLRTEALVYADVEQTTEEGSATQTRVVRDPVGKIGRASPANSIMVTIGHSFGGAILFDAVSPILTERAALAMESARAEQRSSHEVIPGLGESLLIVNPAFEGTRYENFDLLQEELLLSGSFAPRQKTALAVVTSTADRATRVAFPVGRFFANWWDKHRPEREARGADQAGEGQGQRSRRAVGHIPRFRTHQLVLNDEGKCPQERVSVFQAPPFSEVQAKVESQSSKRGGGPRATPASDAEILYPNLALRALAGTADRLPYKVIQTDECVIADHGDIYNELFLEFLVDAVVNTRSSGLNTL